MDHKTKILKEGLNYRGLNETFERNLNLSKFLKSYANQVVTEGTLKTFEKHYLCMDVMGRKLLKNLLENDSYVRKLATVKTPLLFEGYLNEAGIGPALEGPAQNHSNDVRAQQLNDSLFKKNTDMQKDWDAHLNKETGLVDAKWFQDKLDQNDPSWDSFRQYYSSEGMLKGVNPESMTIAGSMADIAKNDPTAAAELTKVMPGMKDVLNAAKKADVVKKDEGFMGWLQGIWDGVGSFFHSFFQDPIKTIAGGFNSFAAWATANPGLVASLAVIPAGLFILSKIKKAKGNK